MNISFFIKTKNENKYKLLSAPIHPSLQPTMTVLITIPYSLIFTS